MKFLTKCDAKTSLKKTFNYTFLADHFHEPLTKLISTQTADKHEEVRDVMEYDCEPNRKAVVFSGQSNLKTNNLRVFTVP